MAEMKRMKRLVLVVGILFLMSPALFAQKDIEAWKNEKNLEQQYEVFKKNLDYWSGKYIITGKQMDEFYGAFNDSVSALENETKNKATKINALQNDLNAVGKQLEDTKAELETSIKNQNAIEVFGMNIEKSVYTIFMSLFILSLLILLGIIFLLYRRSNAVTIRTKKDYNELKEEFEVHKKNALERYTSLNMELHRTRMERNKR